MWRQDRRIVLLRIVVVKHFLFVVFLGLFLDGLQVRVLVREVGVEYFAGSENWFFSWLEPFGLFLLLQKGRGRGRGVVDIVAAVIEIVSQKTLVHAGVERNVVGVHGH